jgi:hypothetical protein
MARRTAIAVLAAAVLATPAATAARLPSLRSVTPTTRHLSAVFALGDLAPGRIAVATSDRTELGGAFAATSVVVREWMSPRRLANGLERWTTRHTLRPGVYYVEVSGVAIGIDCKPGKPGTPVCREVWSRPRRVLVPPR